MTFLLAPLKGKLAWPSLFFIVCLFSTTTLGAIFEHAGSPIVNIEKVGKQRLNGVTKILQDSMGFIWLVNKNGLLRYDSNKVIRYPGFEQFTSDTVTAIVEGQAGSIWIGSKNNGLVHFNTRTTELTFYNLQEKFKLKNSSNNVEQLLYKNNTLYLTSKNQLLLINESNLAIINQYALPIADSDMVLGMLVDSADNIWLSNLASDGIFLIKDGNTLHYQHLPEDPNSIGAQLVITMFEDTKGTIWFGTLKGLSRYSPNRDNFINYQPLDLSLAQNKNLGFYANVLTSIVEDAQGNLWLGLFNNGLFKFEPDSEIFTHLPRKQGVNTTVLDNSITGGLFIDNQQTLWILNNKGISQLDRNNQKFNQWVNVDTNTNDDCTPFNVHQYQGKVFFHCFNTFNSIVNNKVHKLLTLNSKIRTVAHTSKDTIWLATMGGGVFRHNVESQKTKQYLFGDPNAIHTNSVKQLRLTSNNSLYGITNAHPNKKGAGIIRYNPMSDSFEQFATGLEIINFVDINAAKMLLIGSYDRYEKALYWFDKHNQQIEQLPILTGEVYAATQWQNRLWLSTQNLGLISLDTHSGTIQKYSITMNKAVNGLYVDSDNQQLYLSTAMQLHRVEAIENTHITTLCLTCNLKTEYQGINLLDSGQFVASNASMLPNKQFFISEKNRLLNIALDYDAQKNAETNLHFTRLTILNKPVFPLSNNANHILKQTIESQQSLTIPAGIQLFSIGFTNIDFLNNNNTSYRYKLIGLNDHWIETDAENAEAVYSLLPPGSYTLKVITKDPLGNWPAEHESISLAINVLPQWWQTWWAYSLYSVMALLVIALCSWLYINKRVAVHAKNMAWELMQSKENLFANLSHEFRTPLTLILGPAEAIKSSSNDTKTHKNATLIERNALRLLNIIDQILYLAQLKELKKTQPITQSVAQVCQQVVQSFSVIAQRKNIRLSITSSISSTWGIISPNNALETILYNLLSNAIKYTPSSGIITLTIEQQQHWLKFTVSDTGCGIAPTDHTRIFERFTRLKNNSNASGVGIGLALVKETITALGGNIYLESDVNAGASFIFTLPMASHATQRENSSNNTSLAVLQHNTDLMAPLTPSESQTLTTSLLDNDISQQDTHQPSLLIVEDNNEMRAFIKETLKQHYQIFEAIDGQQAFTLACQYSPDIIVSDIMMPKMDGFELLSAIRNEMAISHTPVILLTAKNDPESKFQGLSNLADDYLTKPFNRKELLLRIENLLGIRTLLQAQFNRLALPHSKPLTPTEKVAPKRENGIESMTTSNDPFLLRFQEVIAKNHTNPELTLTMVSREFAMSERQLQRKIKAISGRNFTEILRSYRLERSCQLLTDSTQQHTHIAIISDQVGFNSSNYFVRCFKAQYGKTPNEYRKSSQPN